MAFRRILITCSRTWRDWQRADAVLGRAYQLAPDAILVSGHARQGDQDLERLWRGYGGQVETYEPDWEGPCRPQCWPPYHRKLGKNGREFCPAAGDWRNHDMAELPGVVLCLAFLMPCMKEKCEERRELVRKRGGVHYTHGARECADYAQYEVKIPTRRFTG
jgi:hypothetical protein